MAFWNKWFGFRWSLYFVLGENQLIYAMHENSALRLVGYVMGYFANGGIPAEPWSLYLNFNHEQKSILLKPDHFASTGENVSPFLIREIENLDSGWRVKGGEPVFIEVVTNKRIKLNDRSKHSDVHAMLANAGQPREATFYTVMDEIFRKNDL